MPCWNRPGTGAGKTAGKMSRRYRTYTVKYDFSQCINGIFSSFALIPVPEACLTPIPGRQHRSHEQDIRKQ